jgi:cell division septum initiation protein DivIVA
MHAAVILGPSAITGVFAMSDDETEVDLSVPRGDGGIDVRDPLPRAVRDPSFPTAVRGYDRRAVDVYVERVNRLIAELQVSGSPKAAVRHALERVGEQTSGILQRARETAEEITTGAREEADETTARARAEGKEIISEARREASEHLAGARAEADEVLAAARAEADEALTSAKDQAESTIARARVEAEGRVRRCEDEIAALHEQATARMHALQADLAALADERRTLLDGLGHISARLVELVSAGDGSPSPADAADAAPDGEAVVAPEPERGLAAAAGVSTESTDRGRVAG